MRSTNINFKRGILFFVFNTTCWLENVRRSTRVFSVWNLFSNCLLFCSWVVFGNCYYLRWLGRGRAREKRREKGREKSERRWILGEHSLAEVEVRTKISVKVVLTTHLLNLVREVILQIYTVLPMVNTIVL